MLPRTYPYVSFVFVLMACMLVNPHESTAERSLVDTFASWVIEGVQPQDINGPSCQSDSQDFLGHVESDDPTGGIEASIAANCQAKANPRTGEPPPLIYGCYTITPHNLDFDEFTPEDTQCYCDYYLCDRELQQPFEETVDFSIKVVEQLGLFR
jgi:hypothetical protein